MLITTYSTSSMQDCCQATQRILSHHSKVVINVQRVKRHRQVDGFQG